MTHAYDENSYCFECDKKMKTSEKAKAAGFKDLNELSKITGQSTQTLRNWDANKPELFEVVLAGAINKR